MWTFVRHRIHLSFQLLKQDPSLARLDHHPSTVRIQVRLLGHLSPSRLHDPMRTSLSTRQSRPSALQGRASYALDRTQRHLCKMQDERHVVRLKDVFVSLFCRSNHDEQGVTNKFNDEKPSEIGTRRSQRSTDGPPTVLRRSIKDRTVHTVHRRSSIEPVSK